MKDKVNIEKMKAALEAALSYVNDTITEAEENFRDDELGVRIYLLKKQLDDAMKSE